MANDRLRVWIEDHTGNRRREARVSPGVAVSQLIPALIGALGLPATDPNGRPVSYRLAFGDRQLQGDESLSEAEVGEGASITLVPEMTAGAA